MASGYGYSGGRSRCFAYWQEFAKCYAQADKPSECVPQKADYIECLHHTKEKARVKQVQAELVKRAHQEGVESVKAALAAAEGGRDVGGSGLIAPPKEKKS